MRRLSLASGLLLLALVGAVAPTLARDRSLYPSSPRQRPDGPVVPLELTSDGERAVAGQPTGPAVPCGRGRWLVATDASLTAVSSSGDLIWERPDLAGALLAGSCARDLTEVSEPRHRVWLATRSPAGLVALEGSSGRTVSTVPLPAEPVTFPVIFEYPHASTMALAGEVWVPLADGRLTGFDLADGAPEWTAILPGPATAAPVRGRPGEVLVVVGSGLVRVGTRDAAVESIVDLPAGATSPAVRLGRNDRYVDLFLAAEDGRLYSYRCRSKKRGTRCKERWSYRTGSRMTAPALLAEGLVLAFSWDNFIYALSPDNGHLRWRQGASHRLTGQALPYRDRLLMAPAASGGLAAFRILDGTPSGEYRAGEDAVVLASPAARGDEVAVLLQAGPGRTLLRILAVRERPPETAPADTDGGAVSPTAP